MAATTAFLFVPGPADDPGLAEEDVLGRDADGALAFVVEQRRRADQAAAQELRGVAHWCDLHRTGGVVGAVAGDLWAEHGREPLLGREGDLRLAGEGAFTVEEFAVAELAASLGMAESSAREYVGEALELRDRLPRLWAKVMAGAIPAWRGRQVAAQTIPLTAAAADYVDRHLAPFAATITSARLRRAVRAAILRHDPAMARQLAEDARDGRGVWLREDVAGVSEITARVATPDARAFDRAVGEMASALAWLGDTDHEQARRAKAVGVLADPQYALDIRSTIQAVAEDGEERRLPRRTGEGGPVFHIHLHHDAVRGCTDGAGVARVGGLGAQALATVEGWLADVAPGARVVLAPVVDLADRISVDSYEVPDRLRRQVEERDTGCVFPWCGRQGRFDVDHVVPYLPLADGGPPGQTASENTGRLCRFHHRVKTRPGRHGTWSYRVVASGTFEWTSPLGRRYTVDETGTRPAG